MTDREQLFYISHIMHMPYLMDMVLNNFEKTINPHIHAIMVRYYSVNYQELVKILVLPIIQKIRPLSRELLSIMKCIKGY